MMMRRYAAAVVLGAGLAVAGCTDNQGLNTATGALAGAALGSQIGQGSGKAVAVVAGTAAGAIAGSRVPTN